MRRVMFVVPGAVLVACSLLIACTENLVPAPVSGPGTVMASSARPIARPTSRPSPATASPSPAMAVAAGPHAVIATGLVAGEPLKVFEFPSQEETGLGLSWSGETITGCCLRPLWSPVRAAVYWEPEGILIAFASDDVARVEYWPIATSGHLEGDLLPVSDGTLHIPRVAIFKSLAPLGPDGYIVGVGPSGREVWRREVALPPFCQIARCLGFLETYRKSAAG